MRLGIATEILYHQSIGDALPVMSQMIFARHHVDLVCHCRRLLSENILPGNSPRFGGWFSGAQGWLVLGAR